MPTQRCWIALQRNLGAFEQGRIGEQSDVASVMNASTALTITMNQRKIAMATSSVRSLHAERQHAAAIILARRVGPGHGLDHSS